MLFPWEASLITIHSQLPTSLHFLLTNDDGIHAPGLAAMAKAVNLIPGASCTVVAPESERSMCGHRLTTHEPLLTEQIGHGRYAVSGTPADCVRLALFALEAKPDMVLSGVNAGGNMGQDIPVSGTCAAAREAAYHGLPAVAMSHYLKSGLKVDWERAARWAAEVLREILQLSEKVEDDSFWNVNFPHLPEGDLPVPARVATVPCRAPLLVSYESRPESEETGIGNRLIHRYNARYADRPVLAGSDVEACFGGQVSVSRVRL